MYKTKKKSIKYYIKFYFKKGLRIVKKVIKCDFKYLYNNFYKTNNVKYQLLRLKKYRINELNELNEANKINTQYKSFNEVRIMI